MAGLRIGVVGTGAMGRHHVRILAGLEGVELVGISDLDRDHARALAEEHGTRAFGDPDELAREVEAMVVAVPTSAHAETGVALLERGVHVLVEKPMAASLEEADRLLAAARGGGRVLAVGHVEFYNPAVQALLAIGETARFIEVHRLSPFTPRSLDVDVLLDLMIHDLQIIQALDPSPLAEVRATGIDVLSPKIDIASARVELASGLVANVTASRVSADRVRKLRVYLQSRYVSLDYRKQEIKGFGLAERGGRREIRPARFDVEPREPLAAELEAFVAACAGRDVRYVDGEEGRRALATALEVRDAIANRNTHQEGETND